MKIRRTEKQQKELEKRVRKLADKFIQDLKKMKMKED